MTDAGDAIRAVMNSVTRDVQEALREAYELADRLPSDPFNVHLALHGVAIALKVRGLVVTLPPLLDPGKKGRIVRSSLDASGKRGM